MKFETFNKQVMTVCLIITVSFLGVLGVFFAVGQYSIHQYTEQITESTSKSVSDEISHLIRELELSGTALSQDDTIRRLVSEENMDTVHLKELLGYYQSAYPVSSIWLSPNNGSSIYVYDGEELNVLDDSDTSLSQRAHAIISSDTPIMTYDRNSNLSITAGYPIRDGSGAIIGSIGTSVNEAAILASMKDCNLNDEQDLYIVNADGDVLMQSDNIRTSVTNLLDTDGLLADHPDVLKNADVSDSFVWLNRSGMLKKGETLCEVHFLGSTGLYTVLVNRNTAMLTAYRQEMVTAFVLLSVLLVFIVLLIAMIIRNYRTQIIQLATTDVTTGLANRSSFISTFTRYQNSGRLEKATVFLLDIDFFKRINDTYGHNTGDKALSYISGMVRKTVDGHGFAGRWGGDEFIGVLDADVPDPYGKLKEMVTEAAASDAVEGVRVSVSVGATKAQASYSINRCVEEADAALYQSKKNGRGLLSIYQETFEPDVVYEQASAADAVKTETKVPLESPAKISVIPDIEKKLINSLIYAVRMMIPFVAAGGTLIALSFLIDSASIDITTLTAASRSEFGSITPLAGSLFRIGQLTFNFMQPIFAASLAVSIGGKEALVAGFIGGYVSSQGTAGFAGAILAGLFAGWFVSMIRGFLENLPDLVRRIAPVVIYPIVSLLTMQLLMTYAINPVATLFNTALATILENMQNGNRILLAGAAGAMMGSDMGGPINKAAYYLGTSSIKTGSDDIMAFIMAAGMVPPVGLALSTLLFPKKYTRSERQQAPVAFLMGLSFITEGALPYVLTDIVRVIPACMAGASAAGMLSEWFGCTLMAPHGGIFVLPVIGKPLQFILALAIGSLVTALLLGIFKQDIKTDA